MEVWESIKNYLENGTDLKELLTQIEDDENIIYVLYGMLKYIDDNAFLEDHQEYLMNYLEHQYNLQY
ncbi:hypothetical protein [Nostoc phage A1]|nr:hypothetical protein [Nostoc phage A1]